MTKTSEKNKEEKRTRPPVVVVMGHIDHGKTKILDWYRKTKVVEQESGGITQHIGAYEVDHKGKKITFIDTPGHQAFSKMRSRGAQVADIAILVVAADEGVKPQTKEAIDIIQGNKLPFVVAINKIDKPEANVDKVKQQLAEAGVLIESYGGQTPAVEISAKNGEHMDDLLEVLLLLAELENLEYGKETEGVVIEAHLDPKRGITSTLLIRNGTISAGDVVAIGRSVETIKILEDFLGKPITEAHASSPILVVGLSATPMVGDAFRKFPSKSETEKFIQGLPAEEKIIVSKIAVSEERPIFNVILKADVVGSKEVLEDTIKNIETESIGINILKSGVGNIGENDVKLALATKLVTIVGFKVKTDPSARELAQRSNIHLVEGEIIYDVLDALKKEMEGMLPPLVSRIDLGKARILKVFKKEGSKQIVGGRVEDGKIKRGSKFEVRRTRDIVGSGTILQLQKDKNEADEVGRGAEFGIMAEAKATIEPGDILEVFEEEIIKQKL